MKIGFFNSAKTWGGGEKWHFEISTALNKLGWESVVYTNQKSELFHRLLNSGLRVYAIRITNLSFLNPFKLLLLISLFKTEKIHAIVLNLSADLKVAGFAAKLAGVNKIIYRRGSAIPIKNTWLNRILFRKIVTEIITNSEETKKTILENNPNLFPADKITVIYNGLNLKNYDNAIIIQSFPKNNDVITIGNLGRLVRQKGQHYLIELAIILKKRNIPAKIIIGGSGPLEEELLIDAEQNNVGDIVSFAGFINDVKGFMMSLDIFVLTSLWEGFGYVITEAMYFKKPVIAFNVSSNPELIIDGKDGFLVSLGDMQAMADKIEYLYQNRKILSELGEYGHEKVRQKFNFEKTLKSFISFMLSSNDILK